ncbi:MAG: amino acid adenylation domain-containing protein, partial [Candidatus Aminicenantes bacterium]
YIGGDALARGYLNQVELTAEKFLPVFYKSYKSYRSYISKKIYKTGDLARRLPDGNIEFLGRMDEQVKIRGYRIELKEIESQLLTHSDVKEAVVIAKETYQSESSEGAVDKTLCAYIVPEKDVEISELIAYLSVHLPDYMVPSYFMPVERIPLTPNGKVDKKALPEPKIEGTDDTYAAPENKVQVKLVEIWSKVLGIDKGVIGIDSNFFELGGHSLKATILIAKIHKAFHVKIPLAEIFKNPFIRELADYIDRTAVKEFSGIEPVEKKDYYVLSFAQKRHYILQQLEPNSTGYNESIFSIFEGQLDRGRFEGTFRKLIQRHESLRTSFHLLKDEPVQRVCDELEFEIEYHDFQVKDAGSRLQVEEVIHNFVRPFDLTQAPLIRVGLIREEEEKHVLLIDMHHIITDGTSMGILKKEFLDLYKGERPGPLGIQYKDFSVWQTSDSVRKTLDHQESFWLEAFEGEIPVLELPTDYPRPVEKSYEGQMLTFPLEPEASEALRKLARQEKATLYMVLLAMFNVLLYKLSASQDIVVGTPVAGRRHADLQSVIGMFINTLALHNYPRGDRTFENFLKEVKIRTLEAFENQDYPFEDLVERLQLPRDSNRNPLFEVMFVHQNMELPTLEISQLRLAPYHGKVEASKFDITVHVHEFGPRITFTIEFCTKLFKAATIQRIAGYFEKIVTGVAGMPGQKISAIDLISEEEKNQVLYQFNNPVREFPTRKMLHQLFEEQVETTPDRTALLGEEEGWKGRRVEGNKEEESHLTYKELNEKANQLAYKLIEKGVKPDTIVGIMSERSLDMIIGILGILKAGGAYMPIDPNYPEKRIKYMLTDSSASILLTSREISNLSSQQAFNNSPKGFPSLAYIIYTSGTTGKPKGVMIEHSSVVNFVVSQTRYFNITVHDRVLQFSSICFDASVEQIFISLINGAILVLINKDTLMDKNQFESFIMSRSISHLHAVPSFLNSIDLKGSYPLKRVISGGDVCPVPLARQLSCWCNFYNKYGPTETTITSIEMKVPADGPDDSLLRLSIGKPINNTVVYLLDEGMKLVPPGVTAELYIGGEGVARGYLNQPELTAERFLPASSMFNMSHKSYIYRTGDLARWLPEGNIEFLGRIDHQVKIRGFRIELGEIENRLLKHDSIKEALVLTGKDKDGEEYLCAYIVPVGVTAVDKNSEIPGLREFISRTLPDYMIPSYFIYLDKVPLTPNGKVNRRALPGPEAWETGENRTAPRDLVEEKLAAIWSEVLKISQTAFGIDDEFFRLGGYSLKAMILISSIHKKLGVKVPLVQLFKTPTIMGLSRYIKEMRPGKYISIDPAEKKEYYLLSPAQKRLYVLQQLDLAGTAYNLLYKMYLDLGEEVHVEKLTDTFKTLIARHESLRTSFALVEEQPVQIIRDEVEFSVDDYDIGSILKQTDEKNPGTEPQTVIENIIKGYSRTFDLSRAPLFRVGLIKAGERNHILLIDMHHIITDGLSRDILSGEFKALYWNRGEQLPGLRLQYKDYARWQMGIEHQESIKQQETYWLQMFSGQLPVLNLATDYQRPLVKGFEGRIVYFLLKGEDMENLKKSAAENNATLYMSILAVLNILLAKLTGQEDIILGTPVAARRHADLEGIVGMFVNTLALRNFPQQDKTFKAFLKEVRVRTLEAFENQEYQFEELVDKVSVRRDTSRNPIFDIMVSLWSESEYWQDIPDMDDSYYNHIQCTSKFDMSFTAVEQGNKLLCNIEYSSHLFKPDTIERIIGYFKKIATSVAARPEQKLSDIDMISEEEKKQVLFDFNDTQAPYPGNKTLHELFAEQVEQTPDYTAVIGMEHEAWSM